MTNSTNTPVRLFGDRVADLRRQANMSQKELASEINRSESWVSQVERDVISVDRLPVLQSLADALGVSLQALRPDMSEPSTDEHDSTAHDIDGLRTALTGHPMLEALSSGEVEGKFSVEELEQAVSQAWEFLHASQFQRATDAIVTVLPLLERAARSATEDDRVAVNRLRARLYQALAATFTRQGEADAAWVAADRAIHSAEQSGHVLDVIAAHFRMAHAFLGLRQYQQSEHVATMAIAALERHVAGKSPKQEALSLFGAFHLVRAVVKAREGERAAARKNIDEARRIAKRLGKDRNDYNTEFGPTNVELHAVSVAVDIGDAGEALDLAKHIDASHLSPERQARLLLDCAKAHTQRRHLGEAVAALIEAEELAPEMIQSHPTSRATIKELIQLAGRRVPAQLAELSHRAAATL